MGGGGGVRETNALLHSWYSKLLSTSVRHEEESKPDSDLNYAQANSKQAESAQHMCRESTYGSICFKADDVFNGEKHAE